jgi:hypothetical protein
VLAKLPEVSAVNRRGEPTMEVPRVVLRAAAVVVFLLATLGVSPVPMTPLGLALWCASTLLVS